MDAMFPSIPSVPAPICVVPNVEPMAVPTSVPTGFAVERRTFRPTDATGRTMADPTFPTARTAFLEPFLRSVNQPSRLSGSNSSPTMTKRPEDPPHGRAPAAPRAGRRRTGRRVAVPLLAAAARNFAGIPEVRAGRRGLRLRTSAMEGSQAFREARAMLTPNVPAFRISGSMLSPSRVSRTAIFQPSARVLRAVQFSGRP